jgi:hypothetical protein
MNKLFPSLPVANGVVPNEHGQKSPASTKLTADLHLTRLALDHVEWSDLLARLVELRKGRQ